MVAALTTIPPTTQRSKPLPLTEENSVGYVCPYCGETEHAYNAETIAAREETARILKDPKTKAYDVDDFLAELKAP